MDEIKSLEPGSAIILIPYTIVDAWMYQLFFDTKIIPESWVAKRTELTSGSARYEIVVEGTIIGYFDILTATPQTTRMFARHSMFTMQLTGKIHDQIAHAFWDISAALTTELKSIYEQNIAKEEGHRALLETIDLIGFGEDAQEKLRIANQVFNDPSDEAGGPKTLERYKLVAETLKAYNAPKERRPRKPSRDDSVERWLDWRDREKTRTGRQVSLADIAKESGHSLSTLKKQSAARNQKEPKLEPE